MNRARFLSILLLAFAGAALAANNKAPVVSLTSPASGMSFTAPATLSISASASDPDGSIAKVEFFQGSTSIGSRTAPPFAITWAGVPAGSYSLTAKATDNAGATKVSSPVSVTVTGPRILISAPSDGATVYGGEAVVTGTFDGDMDSTVLVDNGDSTVVAATNGSEFWAHLPFSIGPATVRAVVARRDRTSDVAAVNIIANSNPLVVFTAPANSVFDAGAAIDLVVDALSPAGAIAEVKFVRDGTIIGRATTAPYRTSWTGAPAGTHTIIAVATDANGYTGSATRTVTVGAGNGLPSVALTSPSDGASFTAPASVAMTATATDADGSIARVEFLQSTSVIGVTNVAPYASTWTGVPPGTYVLTARATDDRSGVATSAPVAITVRSANTPPVVTITSPLAGATFTAPASVTLSATASDADGSIAKVEFFNGSSSIGAAAAPPYTTTWTNVAAGSYSITAKATDNSGAESISAPVSIAVVGANRPPIVTLTSPAPGSAYAAPASIVLSATASDPEGVVARVEFLQGASPIGAVTAPPYTFSWSNVPAGSYALYARAIDDRGASAMSAAVAVTVGRSTLTINSPHEGATVDDDSVSVAGTFDNAGNVGITVNGVVAAVAGNHFYAADVPLTIGPNTLTAVMTGLDGTTASQLVSVTSGGPAAVRMSARPTRGLSPLTTVFEVSARTGVSIQKVEIDADGNGAIDQTLNAPPWTTSAVYLAPGTVSPVVKVTHDSGVVSKSFPIVIQNRVELDQQLRAVWSGMKAALSAGDGPRALRFLDASARDRYAPVFGLLANAMPQIVTSWSDLQPVALSDGIGEYAINRVVNGQNRLFLVYFGQNGDGVWRLGSM